MALLNHEMQKQRRHVSIRKLVERAKGVLMKMSNISEDEKVISDNSLC